MHELAYSTYFSLKYLSE